MEHQGQHGHAANRVDEYGNPVLGQGATGGMGAQSAAGAFTGVGGEEQKPRGILHRSGSSSSSSSSSSEDDGMGGRRKKGMKEKIKEKLPGGHKDTAAGTGGAYGQHTAAGTGGAYGQQGHTGTTGTTGAHGVDTGEKKGLMDKIKEKLPGQH